MWKTYTSGVRSEVVLQWIRLTVETHKSIYMFFYTSIMITQYSMTGFQQKKLQVILNKKKT